MTPFVQPHDLCHDVIKINIIPLQMSKDRRIWSTESPTISYSDAFRQDKFLRYLMTFLSLCSASSRIIFLMQRAWIRSINLKPWKCLTRYVVGVWNLSLMQYHSNTTCDTKNHIPVGWGRVIFNLTDVLGPFILALAAKNIRQSAPWPHYEFLVMSLHIELWKGISFRIFKRVYLSHRLILGDRKCFIFISDTTLRRVTAENTNIGLYFHTRRFHQNVMRFARYCGNISWGRW